MLQGGNYTYGDLMAAKPTSTWAGSCCRRCSRRTTPFDAFNGDTFVVPKNAANPALAKNSCILHDREVPNQRGGREGSLRVQSSTGQPERARQLVQQQFELSKKVGQ